MAIMESFDTIREKATEVAQAAAKKTRQLAEIAKANVSIYSEEDKIKKAQLELGKLYYRDYIVGEEIDEAEYLPWCQQIDESKQTISDLRDYIEELKHEQVEMPDSEDISVETVDKDSEKSEETASEAAEEEAVAEEVCSNEENKLPTPDIQVVVRDESAENATNAEE